MKRIAVYISLGVIAYGVFLITQAPAAFLLDQARHFQPGLQTEQINGTLWQGAVKGLRMRPEQAHRQILSMPLDLSWRWRPQGLFTGLLAFQAHATASELDLAANIAIDRDRQLMLSALEGKISLSRIAALIDASPLMASSQNETLNILAGELQLSDGELAFDSQGRIALAEGEVFLRDMRLTLGDNLHLGDYTARLITKAQLIEAEIMDQGGPLELSGVLQLKPGGNYRCSGQLGVRESATPELRQMLVLLGRPAADGKWRFNFTGAIRQ